MREEERATGRDGMRGRVRGETESPGRWRERKTERDRERGGGGGAERERKEERERERVKYGATHHWLIRLILPRLVLLTRLLFLGLAVSQGQKRICAIIIILLILRSNARASSPSSWYSFIPIFQQCRAVGLFKDRDLLVILTHLTRPFGRSSPSRVRSCPLKFARKYPFDSRPFGAGRSFRPPCSRRRLCSIIQPPSVPSS